MSKRPRDTFTSSEIPKNLVEQKRPIKGVISTSTKWGFFSLEIYLRDSDRVWYLILKGVLPNFKTKICADCCRVIEPKKNVEIAH